MAPLRHARSRRYPLVSMDSAPSNSFRQIPSGAVKATRRTFLSHKRRTHRSLDTETTISSLSVPRVQRSARRSQSSTSPSKLAGKRPPRASPPCFHPYPSGTASPGLHGGLLLSAEPTIPPRICYKRRSHPCHVQPRSALYCRPHFAQRHFPPVLRQKRSSSWYRSGPAAELGVRDLCCGSRKSPSLAPPGWLWDGHPQVARTFSPVHVGAHETYLFTSDGLVDNHT